MQNKLPPQQFAKTPWKAAGALGAQCVRSALSILLFAFKNIPTYVEAQLGWFFPSPCFPGVERHTRTHPASRPARNIYKSGSEHCHKIILNIFFYILLFLFINTFWQAIPPNQLAQLYFICSFKLVQNLFFHYCLSIFLAPHNHFNSYISSTTM